MTVHESEFSEIKFFAEKVYVHYWPPDSPKWSNLITQQVDKDMNKNNEKKQILIKNNVILINNYEFNDLKKIGMTIPLFKKECTLVFEGNFKELFAHVHITTKARNYLEIFNKLMNWRSKYFSDSML
ncbi:MAG: hypothetical protein K8Q89_05745 [Nitrosarchaeum sp.]|nr:hypothetical protein [Nitrosarchaeum sp.]